MITVKGWKAVTRELEISVVPVSCRLAQIPKRHLKCTGEQRQKLFSASFLTFHFYLFLLDVFSSSGWKDITDASSSHLSIVPLFDHLLSLLVFQLCCIHLFWMPANLPSLGHEPRQTSLASCPWPGACWEPLKFLSVSLWPSRMYCLLPGRSWPE